MGRLKLYMIIGGLVLLGIGLHGFYDTLTSESRPFKVSLSDVEKNGIGNHKFVQITDALPAGNFVYSYSTRNGIKENVSYIIYPVLSMKRLTNYALNAMDSTGQIGEMKEKMKAKVIVRLDTSFPVSMVNSFSLDTTPVTIEGMVRTSLDESDKNLLKDDALELESNYVYIVKEKPHSYGESTFETLGGLLLLGFAIRLLRPKKKDTPAAESAAPGTTA